MKPNAQAINNKITQRRDNMTNLRDEIADVVNDFSVGGFVEDEHALADAILAKIKASVPPLVWDGKQEDCYAICNMRSTGYEVFVMDTLERSCDYVWQARFLERGQCDVTLGGGTYEQAKAAANAHHVAQLTDWMMK